MKEVQTKSQGWWASLKGGDGSTVLSCLPHPASPRLSHLSCISFSSPALSDPTASPLFTKYLPLRMPSERPTIHSSLPT